MTVKWTTAVAAAFIMSGCAAYPELATFEAVRPVHNSQTPEVDSALAEAVRLQGLYSSGYRQTAQARDLSQLPIIAAAAAAAWVLLDGGTNAARDVGRIGIGAGAYSEARGQLSAAALADSYIAGYGAMNCVLSEGSNFSGQMAWDRQESLRTALEALSDQIAVTEAARWTQVANPGLRADTLRTEIAVTDQAIAAARTAYSAGASQRSAFNSAGPVFRNAIGTISVRVASAGRVRPAIEFGTLRDRFGPPAPTTATPPAAQGATNVEMVILNIATQRRELIRLTNALVAATPPYSESLERVRECPTLIR